MLGVVCREAGNVTSKNCSKALQIEMHKYAQISLLINISKIIESLGICDKPNMLQQDLEIMSLLDFD
jgi:hypothetical protein